MYIKQAVAQRFSTLCKENNIKLNDLAERSGITPLTVYSMFNPSREDIDIMTIKKLCDGLEMTLGEFFNTPEFDALAQEIE